MTERQSTDLQGYYETYWTPEGFNPQGYAKPELERLFRKYTSPGASCLDVGCGDCGTAGAFFVESGCRYTGVDTSSKAIERANLIGFDAAQIQDSGNLPFESGSFDMAICLEVLEHLWDPAATVREMHRVVRSGGVVLVTVPNVVYWRRRLEIMFGRWNPLGDSLSVSQPWRDPHIRFYTTGALGRLLNSTGFERVFVGGHSGAVLRDLPLVGRYLSKRSSRLYRCLERALPSLLGFGIHGVGWK